jgi:hypothetical protein
MAELYLRRTASGFAPVDEIGAETLKKFKLGGTFRAEVKKPRNYRHHCLFLALLDLCFQSQDKYTDFRKFRRAVAMEAGHVEEFITLDGELHLIPLSYSYDEIPEEDKFTEEFGRAMTVCAHLMHDIGIPELEAEVSRYADEHYGARAA